MNIKLNNKLIKTAVAALALVTTSATVVPTTVTNLTTVSAKAKKHHKKVKKTKKSKKKSYVIANYYDEFKPGYSYTYNKKKGVFIGHKMKKHQTTTTDSDEPKVEQATSTYDVPKVKEFTKDIENEYHIYDERWAKTTITFNDDALTQEQQELTEQAINQINNLGIITLKKTNKKADIEYKLANKVNTSRLAETKMETSGNEYHNLDLLETTTPTIFINKFSNLNTTDFNLKFNLTILHETGHALGLDHNPNNNSKIMYHVLDTKKMNTIDSTHVAIDQDYINGLAILYQN